MSQIKIAFIFLISRRKSHRRDDTTQKALFFSISSVRRDLTSVSENINIWFMTVSDSISRSIVSDPDLGVSDRRDNQWARRASEGSSAASNMTSFSDGKDSCNMHPNFRQWTEASLLGWFKKTVDRYRKTNDNVSERCDTWYTHGWKGERLHSRSCERRDQGGIVELFRLNYHGISIWRFDNEINVCSP